MRYKHILASIDLSPKSKLLIDRAVSIAKIYHSKLSFLHVQQTPLNSYTGLIDVNTGDIKNNNLEHITKILKKLSSTIDYKIKNTFFLSGELSEILVNTIKKNNIDLVVLGHHQDFLGKFLSSAKEAMNIVHIDMLVVPFL